MMTYEEFDKRCDELENAPLLERKTFFADVLAGETEKTDVRMMAYFRYALLFYREGDFRTAREILEPFIIDYKSYRYRPEIIACFNLVGVGAYFVQEYALSRFYIHEGLKIAREHNEVSRYAYEYNNLAVTYLAQQDYEKALEVIREAEKNMPVSDEVMHAYVYRNLAEICCHLDRLDEAKDALAKCLAYRGREILPEEVRTVNTLLTYKSGDTAGYKRCCAELWENLPQLHAQEFLASCKVLFDCGMDAGDNAQVEWVLDAMHAYLRRDPKEAQVGLRAATCASASSCKMRWRARPAPTALRRAFWPTCPTTSARPSTAFWACWRSSATAAATRRGSMTAWARSIFRLSTCSPSSTTCWT